MVRKGLYYGSVCMYNSILLYIYVVDCKQGLICGGEGYEGVNGEEGIMVECCAN